MEKEILWLNNMLNVVETNTYISQSIELIDIHRHRIRSRSPRVDRALRRRHPEPFQFLFHKN